MLTCVPEQPGSAPSDITRSRGLLTCAGGSDLLDWTIKFTNIGVGFYIWTWYGLVKAHDAFRELFLKTY